MHPGPSAAGLFPEEITEALNISPSYRGKQIFKALWQGAVSFDQITTLPKNMREDLASGTKLLQTQTVSIQGKAGETRKIALRCADGYVIECVLLTDGKGRKTLCLSSQAGCGMGCVFCRTGTLGFTRNLSTGEITEQVLHALPLAENISNIVFMGMGEPLLNLEAVRKAAAILTRPEGLGIGMQKMTISTCGIISGIEELRKNGPGFRLAVSLIAAEQRKRERLLPSAKNNPLDKLKTALLRYQESAGKRTTFEYVLLPGINDTPGDIRLLKDFTAGLSAVVNLISWNPVEGMPFRPPSEDEVQRFLEECGSAGIKCTRRCSKGREIGGACGQLGGRNETAAPSPPGA